MRLFILIALVFLSACRQDESPRIEIHDAWARPTPAGNAPAVAYLTISNEGAADRLVSVASDRATATLHLSRVHNGIMEMRPLPDGLAVPGHGTVELAPNGAHVMLAQAGPLRVGDHFDLVLTFEKSGKRTVPVTVAAAGSR